jgi:hypothetical protein
MATTPTATGVLKAEKWAPAALGLLDQEIVLAGLITRDGGADFTGAENDTVNIKRPSRLAGQVEKLRDLHADDYRIKAEKLNERSIPVTLDRHIYTAVELNDAELSLDIENFGAQVLTPQSEAVAQRLENLVAGALNGTVAGAAIPSAGDYDPVLKQIRALRKQLNKNHVPTNGRVLILGVNVEESLLAHPNLTQADQAGDSNALRRAELGTLYGFRLVVSNLVDENALIALHPSAFVLVNRAPLVPEGAKSGSAQAYNGFALRAIRDYDSAVAKDRSFISTFAGLGEVKDYRYEIKDVAGKASVVEVSAQPEQVRCVGVRFDFEAEAGAETKVLKAAATRSAK